MSSSTELSPDCRAGYGAAAACAAQRGRVLSSVRGVGAATYGRPMTSQVHWHAAVFVTAAQAVRDRPRVAAERHPTRESARAAVTATLESSSQPESRAIAAAWSANANLVTLDVDGETQAAVLRCRDRCDDAVAQASAAYVRSRSAAEPARDPSQPRRPAPVRGQETI
jgi:hypothetical protein